MSKPGPDADAIQQRMQQVRSEMRDDVQVMVDNARELTDWTWYVRTYPWVCIGAAAAIGYVIVPGRSTPTIQPSAKDLLELAKQQKIVVKVEDRSSGPSLFSSLLRMAAGSLLNGGLAVATQQLDRYLKSSTLPAPGTNENGRASHHN